MRFRRRLHGSGQIFARTNFVPGPPVYMEQCKFCYRSKWCLHGSVQILRPVAAFVYISAKEIPLFCTAHLTLRITLRLSEMAASHPGHPKRGNKGRFCCSRAFKSNHDNSCRLRRCCFGNRPSPFVEDDHFEAEIASCHRFIIVLRRDGRGEPPFLMVLFTRNRYTENIF